MQEAQQSSASDLYGTDEIEFLLDEIRDLEPACCQLDDIQDFDIAGSRAGNLSLSLAESPLGTCSSWDSHVHYRERFAHNPLPWGVALHCDTSHLKTPTGIVRILLVISSAVCLVSECSAGTVQVGLFLLPLIGRLRLMVFCALFSLLVTCLMLFLDISHIALMFPFNWARVNAWMYLTIGLIFIVGSSLLIHMVFFAEEFMWVPRHTKDTLFISAIIGYVCAIEAFVLTLLTKCPSDLCRQGFHLARRRYRNSSIDGHSDRHASDMCLQEREMTPICSNEVLPYQTHEIPNHHHSLSYNNNNNSRGGPTTPPICNQKPYIPVKRPDQAYNRPPTLGNLRKPSKGDRQGYHYQPIASTSRQSPTFVLDDDPIELELVHDPGPSPRSLDYSSA
uniref:CSON010647 protein n=1 Tax=Culicoides sonorensis TaxID=179676 RepID=A0A336M5V4_CULSO